MVQRELYQTNNSFTYSIIISIGCLIHLFYKLSRIAQSKFYNYLTLILVILRAKFSCLELVFILFSKNHNKW